MKTIIKHFVNVALIVSVSVSHGQSGQQPMIGQQAIDFKLKGLEGETYSLEAQRGSYVVIHFATTWCPFCNAEAPNLEELWKNYYNKSVRVFIVDVKEEQALVEKSFERFHFSFPVLLDTDGEIATKYAPEGVQPALARYEVPIASNLIIDKEGKIRFYSLLNTASFDAKLTELKKKLDELISSPRK